jgi:NADH:ubiquinone oxidoreductase subunit 4 (subunit M)
VTTIAPVVAVVVALGVYPQLVLDRTEETTAKKVQPAQVAGGAGREVTARR